MPRRPPLRLAALALVGLALVAAGGAGVAVGTASLDDCGRTTLTATPVDELPDDAVPFRNLTDPQKDLVRQAVDGKDPRVTGPEWPWFESAVVVRYRGTGYELTTVTSPCPFAPETVVLLGVLLGLLGASALAPLARWVLRARAG